MKKRYPGLLALFILCLCCWSTRAEAYGRIDTEAEVSLTLNFQDDGNGIEGAEFSVYRIADVTETVRYHLTGAFADYPVSLEELDSAGWRSLALTLESYAQRDQIAPDVQGITDENGVISFPGLRTGLYLVTGKPLEIGDYTWTSEAFICSLPELTEEDTWNYDVSTVVKYDQVYSGEPTSRRVIKVWENDDKESRPESIEVQLLKDGVVEDTQRLSSENDWRYTWTGLDARNEWTVTEKEIPDSYTVSIDREGTSIIITNTGREIPQNDTPGTKLPQTGVLWWPVPILGMAGCLLYLIGWIRYRRRKDRD